MGLYFRRHGKRQNARKGSPAPDRRYDDGGHGQRSGCVGRDFQSRNERKNRFRRRRQTLSRPRLSGSAAHADGAPAIHGLSGLRRVVPFHGSAYRKILERRQRYVHQGGDRGDSRIPASCCCRRERLGSALESGVRQYDERLCDGGGFDDERALFGARHERVPSRASARRGADHDFQGLLRAFCREARLRRANDRNGAADGAQGCGQGGGFRRGVGGAAKGVRRGRAENVRLRHSPRRVRKDGD